MNMDRGSNWGKNLKKVCSTRQWGRHISLRIEVSAFTEKSWIYEGKVQPITGHEGPEVEWRNSSTLSLTSALYGVGGQRHSPAALPPEKTLYPLYRRLDGPQGRSGRMRKISPPTGIRSPDRPARSESLYRLSYPGPYNWIYSLKSSLKVPLNSYYT